MSFFELKNEPLDYPRIAVRLIGIGDYGTCALNLLNRDGIGNVAYNEFGLKKQDLRVLTQVMGRDDVVIIIANCRSSLSTKIIPEIVNICRDKSRITILLLQLSGNGTSGDSLISKLKGLPDTLFVIPGPKTSERGDNVIPYESYKLIYCCVKILTDICGDRRGLLNTDLGDIAGSIRDGGMGYIGYGEAKGENAVAEATDKAIRCFANSEKLQKATGLIVTISYQDCSIVDVSAFFVTIGPFISDKAMVHYNIYPDDNPNDLCSVIILSMS